MHSVEQMARLLLSPESLAIPCSLAPNPALHSESLWINLAPWHDHSTWSVCSFCVHITCITHAERQIRSELTHSTGQMESWKKKKTNTAEAFEA